MRSMLLAIAVLLLSDATQTAPANRHDPAQQYVQAHAEPAAEHYSIAFNDLRLTEGRFPRWQDGAQPRWDMRDFVEPRVVLDGRGTAYIGNDSETPWRMPSIEERRLVVKARAGERITGTLYLPELDLQSMATVRFEIEPRPRRDGDGPARTSEQDDFDRVRSEHYQRLLDRGAPGAAWFRYQVGLSPARDEPEQRRRDWGPEPIDFDDTFALLSGNRAIAENLQLDRALPAIEPGDRTIPFAEIPGITIAEFDWTEHLAELQAERGEDAGSIELDPLALTIPFDQHAVFFSSPEHVGRLAREFSEEGMPILNLGGRSSTSHRTFERYQRQLGLSPEMLVEVAERASIDSVAITGSDPHFIAGTDVAVLLASRDLASLERAVVTQIESVALERAEADVSKRLHTRGSASVTSFEGPHRSVSSHVARIDDAVVVTNSLAQLDRLLAVHDGETASLATLDEYRFFRHRYPLHADSETAFVMITDATIRRWAGPRWRIVDARRTVAAAALAHSVAATIGGGSTAHAGTTQLGAFTHTAFGPHSERYGSLEFMTPIIELDADMATPSEREAYAQWRDGYQRNWRWVFDPIAISFEITDDRLAADVSVVPLIMNTDYGTFLSATRNSSHDADPPHGAIMHGVISIDPDAPFLQQYNAMAISALGLDFGPLSFLGDTIQLYAEPDEEFWTRVAGADPDVNADDRIVADDGSVRVPVVFEADVDSMLKLTATLASVRGLINQMSPETLVWETREHDGQAFVAISLSEPMKSGSNWDEIEICYAALPGRFLLTLDERSLKRAIDRVREPAHDNPDEQRRAEANSVEDAWLGRNVALDISKAGIDFLLTLASDTFETTSRQIAWSPIPILNEWKRLHPDRDPVAFHEEHFRVRLIDPAGGAYVWNERYQTMESTIFGHPGEQRSGPTLAGSLGSLVAARFGLTFADGGVRARTELRRDAP